MQTIMEIDVSSNMCDSMLESCSLNMDSLMTSLPSEHRPEFDWKLQELLSPGLFSHLQTYQTLNHLGIVCETTTVFCGLTKHAVTTNDVVIELGCSYGECTAILAVATGDPSCVIGVETGKEVIMEAQKRNPTLNFSRLNVLKEPYQVSVLIRQLIEKRPGHSLVICVDIGGNREVMPLVLLISWIQSSAVPVTPRLIIVKSQSLYGIGMKNINGLDSTLWKTLNEDANRHVPKAVKHLFLNPLDMQQQSTKDGVPICRFHNYTERGCVKFMDPLQMRTILCIYDHEHCSACLEKGHRAIHCPRGKPLL